VQKRLLHAPSPARELSTELASRPRRAVGRSPGTPDPPRRSPRGRRALTCERVAPVLGGTGRWPLQWAWAERIRALSRAVRVNLARTSTINAQACSSGPTHSLLRSHRHRSNQHSSARSCAVFRLLPLAKNNMFQASPAGDFGAWGGDLANLGGAAISRKLAYNSIAHLLSLALK